MFCYLWSKWLLLLSCSSSSSYNLPPSQLINNVASGRCTGLKWDGYVAFTRTQLVSALRLCKALTRQVFPSPHISGKLFSKEFQEDCDEHCSGVHWSHPGTTLSSSCLPSTWLLLYERAVMVTNGAVWARQREDKQIGQDLIAFLPETAIFSKIWEWLSGENGTKIDHNDFPILRNSGLGTVQMAFLSSLDLQRVALTIRKGQV